MSRWDRLALAHNDRSGHNRAQCHMGISSEVLAKLSTAEEIYLLWLTLKITSFSSSVPQTEISFFSIKENKETMEET